MEPGGHPARQRRRGHPPGDVEDVGPGNGQYVAVARWARWALERVDAAEAAEAAAQARARRVIVTSARSSSGTASTSTNPNRA